MPAVRFPAVAGAFYESVPERLKASMKESFVHRLGPGHLPTVADNGPRKILGMICPHAGFQYSGAAAAWAYDALAADGRPKIVILLGTNHRLAGAPAAIETADCWATPLGRVPVNAALRDSLRSSRLFEEDDSAHEYEHSIEVQLPWLQFLYGDTVPICPVSLGHLCHRALHSLSEALTEALFSRDVLIIASSDFSHYVPHDAASELDRVALEQVLALDPDGLLSAVEEKGITMCGVAPVAIMLATCRRLGAAQGRLLTYYTSGDITGDLDKVVGYGSVVVEK
ncbi:MAG: AmmeMemoRadiSam system protein B [Armatimonadetes bacterium]|nr:AmmeMemoRadiSam system protein B [Armatimonadota bacterium]NIM23141.1 AmmeMemoRadiSam system protein B [Armatimonadota bacterium]NIM67009.1 AmmeMemoRadiSam system protein B [Armatimonadota bacterium]NIM75543.1 AmmeMemoRadiSam system protein B [Armatimonadota bacterium]NIN05198.1 AmmeMemoRadiSam system protein B [Armatimonadota bacterium]